MRVLHLSDLHWGMEKCKKMSQDDIVARDNYMEGLLNEISKVGQDKAIKYVFITGDIAFFAKKEEYEKASEWITKLINICNIPNSSVFICPGNHDVDRDELFDKEVPNNQKKANELLNTDNLKKLSVRFEKYAEFCQKLGVASYKIGNIENYLVGVTEREDINVICVNTSWFAKSDKNKNEMWVGKNFIERIKNDKLYVNNLPTIAIMHHPDTSWHQEERSNYNETTNVYLEICKMSNIIWYGHTHEVKNDHIYKEEAYICGSGAVYENNVYHNNFHVYDIGDNIINGYNSSKEIYKYSSGEWDKQKKNINVILKNKIMSRIKEISVNISKKNENILNILETKISSQFIDSIVSDISNDSNKIVLLEEVIQHFINKDSEQINWDNITAELAEVAKTKKIGLSIQGFEGTGKSTFLSLLYLRLKLMKTEGIVNQYPVYIDLHQYDQSELNEAKEDLNRKFHFLSEIIEEKKIQLFLILDGGDDYSRKNNELEGIAKDYISQNQDKFILCIGNVNQVERSRKIYRSPLHSLIQKNHLKLRSRMIDVSGNMVFCLLNYLSKIYLDKSDRDRINAIIRSLKKTGIKQIDFRTLVMCVRIGSSELATSDLTIGSIIYKYLLNISGNASELYNISRVSTIYTITEEEIRENSIKQIDIIYKGKLIREYLIAYYFLETVVSEYREEGEDYERICKMPFVFTPLVNNFVKEMINGRSEREQNKIVDNLQKMYMNDKTTMSMKSQICYYLGRVDKIRPKNKAITFLKDKAVELEQSIYKELQNNREQDIQMPMVLYRTVSVSLVLMGHYKLEDTYIDHLIYDDILNSINRGFHMEYYSDKEYHLGESPDYYDDINNPIDNVIALLMGVIGGRLKDKNCTNIYSTYLDIITLFSIYISRIEIQEIFDKYYSEMIEIANTILKSDKIISMQVRSYVSSMKEIIENRKPYKYFIMEMNKLKTTERAGWSERKISRPESVADHILGSVYLAEHFLPDDISEFKEYEGITDTHNYEQEYNKRRIINMLLIHDMGEAYIGDKINKSEDDAKKENERFGYYAMLCTLPKLHGMNYNKEYWEEFYLQNSINAKIAHDIDKLEALIQAYNYKCTGEKIDLLEWIDSVRGNVKTSLGNALLQFFIEEIINNE